VLQAERGAELSRQPGVERAARQTDLDAHQAALAGGIEQPRDAEPADTEPVGDVDFGDAFQVELPRHPRGEDNFGRPIR
jgi:hypothetical protein